MVFLSVNTPTKTKGVGAGQASDLRWIQVAFRWLIKLGWRCPPGGGGGASEHPPQALGGKTRENTEYLHGSTCVLWS